MIEDSGVDAVIEKPMDIEQLIKVTKEVTVTGYEPSLFGRAPLFKFRRTVPGE